MAIESAAATFLEHDVVTFVELVERSGLSEQEVVELVECGAFDPTDARASTWTFSTQCIVVARRAYRLREQLALEDTHALAVVVRLFQRIEALENQLRTERARR